MGKHIKDSKAKRFLFMQDPQALVNVVLEYSKAYMCTFDDAQKRWKLAGGYTLPLITILSMWMDLKATATVPNEPCLELGRKACHWSCGC